MNNFINIIIYAYKSKTLKAVVDNLIKKTRSEISIHVIDQHPLKRENLFSENKNVYYQHVLWDNQSGEAFYRKFGLKKAGGEYTLIISDDILVKDDWDIEMINFISDKNAIISGSGMKTIFHKDLFTLGKKIEKSDGFTLAKYIDRNFIFGKTKLLKDIDYPDYVKYFGQEELLSLNLFLKDIDIFSSPSGTFEDLNNRVLENSYAAFSLEHNYNIFIDKIKQSSDQEGVKDFLMFHSIDVNKIHKLPFQKNDVEYDPKNLAFDSVDGRRFVGKVNGIR